MTLLREIQTGAVSSTTDLPGLLRQCKVLAARLKLAELAQWSSVELNGYAKPNDVPTYRRIQVRALGHFIGSFNREMKNVPIPPISLPEQLRYLAEFHTFTEGVSALAGLTSGSRVLHAKWPADALALLQTEPILENGLVIVDAWSQIPQSAVLGILDTVRTRILDFALAIEAADPLAGDRAPGESSSVTPAQGATIFYTTIINGQANIGTDGDASISVTPGTTPHPPK